VALAFQLHALGVLNEPQLEFDTDCVRMLEEMYEDQGDTLALQYGGSALVHRIKSYRKLAPWTSKGNDIMQTMRRYYSNTLSDAEKQNTMNVFLGIYTPEAGKPHIWEKEYNFDYYLHHKHPKSVPTPLTQWWNPDLLEHLPFSLDMRRKTCTDLTKAQQPLANQQEDYYHPFELTVLNDLFAFSEINHSVRDYMPNFTTDFSPFSVRERLGKKREEMSSSKTNLSMKNPSVAGNSTSSTTSTEDDSDQSGSESSDSDPSLSEQNSLDGDMCGGLVTFESLFPSMRSVYGAELKTPAPVDMQLYRRNSTLSRDSGVLPGRKVSASAVLHPLARPILRSRACPVPVHDYTTCLLPPISADSEAIYRNYIKVGEEGANHPSEESLQVYSNYVTMCNV